MATPYTCIRSKTNQHLVIAGSDQNRSLHLGREQKINHFFPLPRGSPSTHDPSMSGDLGSASYHFVKDATINTLCKAQERGELSEKKSQMKPGHICEIYELKSNGETSYWTLRLSIVFNRVKNYYLLLCVCVFFVLFFLFLTRPPCSIFFCSSPLCKCH